MWFYSNFDWEHLFDGEFNSTSNEDPLVIRLVDPAPRKIRNTLIMFFHVFLVFRAAGSTKSMPSGYSLDVELNSPSHKFSQLKFE